MKNSLELAFVLLFLIFCIGFTLYNNLTLKHYHHFSQLGYSLLQGRLDIQFEPDKSLDTFIAEDGRKYFGQDPLAGILMMPFAAIGGPKVSQGYLDFLITMVSILLIYKILATNEATKNIITRLWFILIYFFGSATVSLILSPQPWFLNQNTAMMFVLWAIYEWRTRKRIWVLLIIFIMITLARRNAAAPVGIYFFCASFYLQENWRKKAARLFLPGLGAAAVFIILTYYHNFGLSENIRNNILANTHIETAQLSAIKNYGLWGAGNIPTNFVNYFLSGPMIFRESDQANNYYVLTDLPHAHLAWPYIVPGKNGLSIFFLGPVFLALFFLPFKKKSEMVPILGAILTWMLIYLPFYTSGSAQLGNRYGAEVVPFLFLGLMVLLPAYFSGRVKALVLFSIFLNAFMIVKLTSFYMNP